MAAKRDAKALLAMLSDPDEATRHRAFLALGSTSRGDRAWLADLDVGQRRAHAANAFCA